MKKQILTVISALGLIFSCHICQASASFSSNLAGEYTCSGYDKLDKLISNTTMDISLNAKQSMLENGYAAYNFRWTAPSNLVVKGLPSNIAATGSIAANGNTFALSFKNTNPQAPTDYGTAVGVVTYDQNEEGASQTELHFFSYQQAYKGGDNSTWTCTKN